MKAVSTVALLALASAGAAHAQTFLQFSELRYSILGGDGEGQPLVGDVDGDGTEDLLWLTTGQNRLLRNRGDIGFHDITASHMPAFAQNTTAGVLFDADGDGDLDLLEGYRGAGNRLYLNIGFGHFALHRDFVIATETVALAVGDVDGDGDLDFIAGNHGQPNALRLNDGAGGFSAAPFSALPTPADDTLALALVDIDGDADLDLIEAGNPTRIYTNDGTGRFTDTTAGRLPPQPQFSTTLSAGDLNGDGHVDLVLDRVLLNDGTGVFTPSGLSIAQTGGYVLDDLDGDGDLDAIARVGLQRVFINDGTGTFVDETQTRLVGGPPPEYGGLALVDVYGRGLPDLVIGDSLFLNDGGGVLHAELDGDLPEFDPSQVTALTTMDIDGDGDADLWIGTADGPRLFRNDLSGVFVDLTASLPPGLSLTVSDLTVGDFNGDHHDDVFVSTSTYPSYSAMLFGDGAGGFVRGTVGDVPVLRSFLPKAAAGDVDGDGDLDLLLTAPIVFGPRQNRLFLNDGTGRFSDATSVRLPYRGENTTDVALADTDGDGDLDVLFSNNDEPSRLLINDGTGRFSDPGGSVWPAPTFLAHSVALRDINGDGAVDAVFGGHANAGHQGLNVLHNDGAGNFVQAAPTGIVQTASAFEFADIDEDGALDVIVPTHGGLYLNDGAGGLIDASSRLGGATPANAGLLADFDLDADLDIVLGYDNGDLLLMHNLLRHVHTPWPAVRGGQFAMDLYASGGSSQPLGALLVALQPAAAPIAVPPFGSLLYEPSSFLFAAPSVAINPFLGRMRYTLPFSTDPVWHGITLTLQGAFAHPGGARLVHLSNVDVSLVQ